MCCLCCLRLRSTFFFALYETIQYIIAASIPFFFLLRSHKLLSAIWSNRLWNWFGHGTRSKLVAPIQSHLNHLQAKETRNDVSVYVAWHRPPWVLHYALFVMSTNVYTTQVYKPIIESINMRMFTETWKSARRRSTACWHALGWQNSITNVYFRVFFWFHFGFSILRYFWNVISLHIWFRYVNRKVCCAEKKLNSWEK